MCRAVHESSDWCCYGQIADSAPPRGQGAAPFAQAWGDNQFGQLGNATNTDSDVPVQVRNLTDVTAIATTEDHNLAVRSFCDCGKRGDGWGGTTTGNVVFTWGANFAGERGNNSTTNSNVPVAAVTAIKNVTLIAGGGTHSLAA
ncbi:hypothetical protein [Streptomyces sp. MN13]